MKKLSLLVLGLSQLAFSNWVTPDFFIANASLPAMEQQVTDCRANIKKVICLVEPTKDFFKIDRPCLPGGEVYASHFEELHDRYPEALKKMFCSLGKIHIEKEFFGTAYAGILKDDDKKTIGALMGIRKSVLDEGLDPSMWNSWKEQLSFGGEKNSYKVHKHLPQFKIESKMGLGDFLYFVIAHEFGHIFDFANELNLSRDDKCVRFEEKKPCQFHRQSFGGISWIDAETPRGVNDFPYRKNLCFYWCDDPKNSPVPWRAAPTLYHNLYTESEFISTYATTQAWDDFAESLAYFVVNSELGLKWKLDTAQGVEYDMMAKLHSVQFAKKYRFVDDFLKGPIHYP